MINNRFTVTLECMANEFDPVIHLFKNPDKENIHIEVSIIRDIECSRDPKLEYFYASNYILFEGENLVTEYNQLKENIENEILDLYLKSDGKGILS